MDIIVEQFFSPADNSGVFREVNESRIAPGAFCQCVAAGVWSGTHIAFVLAVINWWMSISRLVQFVQLIIAENVPEDEESLFLVLSMLARCEHGG